MHMQQYALISLGEMGVSWLGAGGSAGVTKMGLSVLEISQLVESVEISPGSCKERSVS